MKDYNKIKVDLNKQIWADNTAQISLELIHTNFMIPFPNS